MENVKEIEYFGLRLGQYLKAKKISAHRLAAQMGKSGQTVRNMIMGKAVRTDVLFALLGALPEMVPHLGWLLLGEGPSPMALAEAQQQEEEAMRREAGEADEPGELGEPGQEREEANPLNSGALGVMPTELLEQAMRLQLLVHAEEASPQELTTFIIKAKAMARQQGQHEHELINAMRQLQEAQAETQQARQAQEEAEARLRQFKEELGGRIAK